MKKVIALCLAFVLMAGACAAETSSAYDYKQLEGVDGYEYKKFDRTWHIYDTYDMEYLDGRIYIGVDAEEMEGYVLACFYVNSLKWDGEPMWEIEGVDVYVDGVIYSFDAPYHDEGSYSYQFYGDTVNKLIRAMAGAESQVSVRIRHVAAYPEYDLDWDRFSASIGRISKVLVEKGVMDAADNVLCSYLGQQHNAAVKQI